MRPVIVGIRRFYAAVLTEDGCIIKVRNKHYAVGQEIELKSPMIPKHQKLFALVAAAVVIMFGLTAWTYLTPYSYVSLDVNPSIEYSVNRFNRVLSVTAVNGDGAEILNKLNLNNKTIQAAVNDTVVQIDKEGYFKAKDPGGIVISTSCENQQNSKELANDLKISAKQATKDIASPIEVDSISVTHEGVVQAQTLGTTPGKLNLVQKLQASTKNPDSINTKDWLKKPVKEIMKAIISEKLESKLPDNHDGSSIVSTGSENSSSTNSSSSVQTEASGEKTESQTVSGSEASNNSSQSHAAEDTSSTIAEKPDPTGNQSSESKAEGDTVSKITVE
jgi:hypothetical protein